MESRHRDGLLAVASALFVVAVAGLLDATAPLTDSGLLAAGVAGAVGCELLLARYPARSAALWDRPPVRVLSTLLVVAVAVAAAVVTPWLLGILAGGLLGYLTLLALVLAGIVPGAESWFDREG